MTELTERERRAAYAIVQNRAAPPENSPAAHWVQNGSGDYPLWHRVAEQLAWRDNRIEELEAERAHLLEGAEFLRGDQIVMMDGWHLLHKWLEADRERKAAAK